MTKTDELLNLFSEKWGLKVIEVMKGDDYIMHAQEECLSDLRTLIKQVEEERMPSEMKMASEEVIFERLVEMYKETPVCVANICDKVLDRTGALLGYVRKGEWFRSRLTEKPNNSERQMWRDIQEEERELPE